ncbi:type 1 glutamine amidotransferase [Saccharopolyspora shandongensis]|uniref:type 1 glutamine amidotransferase n=1 Tax=Saccharopolyspora shandongensis TaxID=418495 RepID=UPI0033CEA3E1
MTDPARSTVLVLQHQPDAGPGNLAFWLDDNGYEWTLVDVPRGLPTPKRYQALVVLGSRESAFDASISWISAERTFVAECAAAGTPVLGLCFGAQLLAMALGGQVHRMVQPERGWTRVEGQPPFGGPWFAWHQDEIKAPPGSNEVARTDRCLHAFTSGRHLGVQYHPEVTPDQIADWLAQPARVRDLLSSGGTVEEVKAETGRRAQEAAASATHLYNRFFAGAAT